MTKQQIVRMVGNVCCALCLVLVLQGFAVSTTGAQQSEPATPAATAETAQPSVVPAIPVHSTPGTAASLQGFSYIRQTWNNCGPATLAMLLSYYDTNLDQATIGAALRPNGDDKNVSPVELAEYAQSQGYQALVRVNGDRERLRTLLANDIPVIIETWLEPHPNDGLGHYRLLVGYDDIQGHWIGYDSYYRENLINPTGEYRGIRMEYAETDDLWRVFNRTYVVVFREDQAATVASILGADHKNALMWVRALETAQAATAQNDRDPFAWFNLGTNLTALGRYEEAAVAYDRARELGLPPRMFWYQFGPLQAYYEVGRYQDVVALADQVLKPAVQIEELQYWKAEALRALNDEAGAAQAMQRVSQLNANYRPHYGTIPTVQTELAPAPVSTVASSPTTSVAQPAARSTVTRQDRASFVADVTIPDGTVVSPGERMIKVWRVRNDGELPWEGYTLQPMAGYEWEHEQPGATDRLPVATTLPGETVDIRLVLTAPQQPGTYTGYWQIISAGGNAVSGGQVWTIFEVAQSAQP
jgi:tetratricopeptide (TPR) repeat protein